MPVVIDYSRDDLLTFISKETLEKKYQLRHTVVTPEGETVNELLEKSPQDAFARAATAFSSNEAHAQRLYDYASKLWFMFASPLLSNGGTDIGFPISCFLSYVPDSRQGLADHYNECIWLSTMGGGIGGGWNAVRSNGISTSKGSESTGIIPFQKVVDSLMLGFQQGRQRRGKYSFNLDVSHPEIEEFIDLVNKKSGDESRRARHSFNCVSIPDKFMEAVRDNAQWALIDPHTKQVRKMVNAQELWAKILTSRMQEGTPYIHFIDRSNDKLPSAQKIMGLKVNQTNLCSEITLPTNEDRTAVCCLSSVNLSKYDQWKDDPQFIPDLVEMLDNVITVFIEKASEYPAFAKAVRSAVQERSIGLGAMGWHDLLQQRGIPFASSMSISLTRNVFKHIQDAAKETTYRLAQERGAAPDYLEAQQELIRQGVLYEDTVHQIGRPVRNLHLLAIAPNATSSIICGNASPGIEPRFSNSYTQRTQNGIFVYKNPFLEELLASLGKNTEEVWKQIKDERGSVQGLDFLTEQQKKTFATAMEIPQYWIIEQAGHRQEFICQAQSLNLFLPPDIDKAELHALHYYAWLQGNVKTLYYARSKSLQTVEQLNAKIERQVRDDYTGVDTSGEVQTVGQVGYGVEDDEVCLACEG